MEGESTMKRALFVAFAVASIAGQVGHAADWTQEPKTFRSITLGEPLASQFPECAKDKNGAYIYVPQNVCWETDNKPNPYAHNAVMAGIYNLPDIGIGDVLIKGLHPTAVYLLDGKVEAISLNFNAARYDSFLELLTNKFGAASISDHIMPTATNQVWGQINTWKGGNAIMKFVEFYLRPEQSRLDIETTKYAALEESDNQSKQQAQQNNL